MGGNSRCAKSGKGFRSLVASTIRPVGAVVAGLALAAAPLQLVRSRNINAEVLRGMRQNSERSQALVGRHLPKLLQSLGRDFAGIKGSRVYQALEQGGMQYRSYCFRKG